MIQVLQPHLKFRLIHEFTRIIYTSVFHFIISQHPAHTSKVQKPVQQFLPSTTEMVHSHLLCGQDRGFRNSRGAFLQIIRFILHSFLQVAREDPFDAPHYKCVLSNKSSVSIERNPATGSSIRGTAPDRTRHRHHYLRQGPILPHAAPVQRQKSCS